MNHFVKRKRFYFASNLFEKKKLLKDLTTSSKSLISNVIQLVCTAVLPLLLSSKGTGQELIL